MHEIDEVDELRRQLAEAKAALGKAREIEERQSFLLRLNDALRPLADPAEIESTASRLLVEHLGANRAIYLELEGSGDDRAAVIRGQYARDVPPWPGRFRYLDFAKGFAEELLESHEAVVVSDAANDPSLSEPVRQAWLSLDVVAVIATSLIKGGKVVAAFGVQSAVPRQWTELDVQLVRDVADRTWEAVERGRAEAAFRDTEERQSFLLKLSDALRAEPNADAVAEHAILMLSEQLRLDRCYIASYRLADDRADILHQVGNDEAPAMPDMIRLSDFPLAFRQVFDQTLVIDDVAETTGLSEADRRNIEALGLRALIAATLRMGENNPLWVIVAVSARPRNWTRGEIALTEEVTERTWAAVERARAEAALRASEEKYRTLFESIDEGFAVVEVAFDEDGRTVDVLHLEANPAYERHTGLPGIAGKRASEVAPGENPWLAMYGKIALTGAPVRTEYRVASIDRWFTLHASRVGGEGSRQIAVIFNDVTTRKRADIALRESEERQAFLLKLSDALRPLSDPVEIKAVACETLGRHLGAGRCGYGEVDATDEFFIVDRDWTDGDMASFKGKHLLVSFGPEFTQAYRAGRTVMIDDALEDARAAGAEAAFEAAGSVRASLGLPLIKNGRFAAGLFVQQIHPRKWTAKDEALARDVIERTWDAVERARAEDALRESEERFVQFANASASALWIRDAETLAMEYASPAMQDIYGVEPDALLGPIERWASLIAPDDRDVALEHIEMARQGESMVHEFRIQRPSDKAFRWVRDTDFPLEVNGHVQRIGGIAEDVTEAKLLAEHQTVLLLELQHRVRNIMAVIRSITARTGERAASVAEYAELMAGRLLALARVQALLTRAANVSVGIHTIVHDEVSAQATHEGQYLLDGPDIELSPKAAEILTLALHELATNAVKYGALSVPNGKVTVRWETFEKRDRSWLALDWNEEGAPERPPPTDGKPRRRGFGSELIEGRIPYELGGRGKVTIGPGGAQCHLEFPLEEGASVLETGAPQRTTIFGGTLDMTGEADLSGHRVLVVEDDFYLATDAARALEGAGAAVIGPCPDEASARAEIEEQRPDAVVLDINLGAGPSFKLAEALKDKGIPFVFTTGYDPEAIPEEFDQIGRLQKPMQLRQIVAAIARLVGKAE